MQLGYENSSMTSAWLLAWAVWLLANAATQASVVNIVVRLKMLMSVV